MKKQIVCLSSANWHPFPTRKQQVMSRFRDAEILYLDPPVSRAAPLKDPAAAERLRAYKKPGESIGGHITVYASPPVWPAYNKFRAVNKTNARGQARYVNRIMEKHGFEKPLLWCYSPTAADLVDRIPHSGLVYDCVDRHSAYGGLMNPAVVDKMERDLAARANVVFATAGGLYDTLKQYNPNTYLLPNGVNFELFHRAAEDDLPFPDDLFNIKNPILGFVGMLQPCIDYDLLTAAADTHPEWSVVLIGKALPGVDLAPLTARKNIHLLGLKPYKDLPNYIKRFDICLNLFASGDLSRDVSPLKFYEYLATGRPVVSTPQPIQVLEFSDAIYIGGDRDSFLSACERALCEKNPWMTRQRIEYGRAASWESRVDEMKKALQAHGLWE